MILRSVKSTCVHACVVQTSANKLAGNTEAMEVETEEPIVDEPAGEEPPVKEKPKPKPTKPQRQLPWYGKLAALFIKKPTFFSIKIKGWKSTGQRNSPKSWATKRL